MAGWRQPKLLFGSSQDIVVVKLRFRSPAGDNYYEASRLCTIAVRIRPTYGIVEMMVSCPSQPRCWRRSRHYVFVVATLVRLLGSFHGSVGSTNQIKIDKFWVALILASKDFYTRTVIRLLASHVVARRVVRGDSSCYFMTHSLPSHPCSGRVIACLNALGGDNALHVHVSCRSERSSFISLNRIVTGHGRPNIAAFTDSRSGLVLPLVLSVTV